MHSSVSIHQSMRDLIFKYLKDEAQLTESALEVIDYIVNTDYVQKLDGGPTWEFEATYDNPSQLRGALSSLIKKGYVGFQEDGEDSTVWIVGYDEGELNE